MLPEAAPNIGFSAKTRALYFSNLVQFHGIHGTGLYTYMNTIKHQPFMWVNIPFVPWMIWVFNCSEKRSFFSTCFFLFFFDFSLLFFFGLIYSVQSNLATLVGRVKKLTLKTKHVKCPTKNMGLPCSNATQPLVDFSSLIMLV